jgi:hypothetical protein
MSPNVARRLRAEHDVPADVLVTCAIPDPCGGRLADYRWCLEEISAALDDLLASRWWAPFFTESMVCGERGA